MTKLEQLIEELCSEGVEYRPFGEMAYIVRGASPRPIKAFITAESDGVNWIKIGDVKPGSKYITETAEKITPEGAKKSRLVKEGDFILSNSMSFGRPYIMKTVGCIHDGWLAISDFDEYFLPDFLYHLLNSNKYQHTMRQKASFGGAVQNLNADIVKELEMPIIPLEIQAEIVRILDNFTNLTAELTAELEARKKQYEHYKYQLLNFDNMVKTSELRDLVNFRNGKGHEKDIVNDGKFIVVNSKFISTNGEMKKYSNKQICPLYIDDILMVMSDLPNGKALSKCYLVSENDKYTLNQRIGAFHVKDDKIIRTKFLYYVLNRNQQLLAYDNGVDQTNLRKDDILNIKIPIPTLSEQERIVAILDRFDKLCNDISEGLPAEIEARKKQYEYYRDRVLSFKER